MCALLVQLCTFTITYLLSNNLATKENGAKCSTSSKPKKNTLPLTDEGESGAVQHGMVRTGHSSGSKREAALIQIQLPGREVKV